MAWSHQLYLADHLGSVLYSSNMFSVHEFENHENGSFNRPIWGVMVDDPLDKPANRFGAPLPIRGSID